MKFEPLPPTPENKVTWVPSGAIRTAVRSESGENAAVSVDGDVGDRERAVVARDGHRRAWSCRGLVELVAAGMIVPVLLVDGKYCGPEIEPAGPMIWSTWRA